MPRVWVILSDDVNIILNQFVINCKSILVYTKVIPKVYKID